MRLSLLITTYERPDALACVLKSVAIQTRAPDEVIVADDGSGRATRDVIEAFRGSSAFPVVHVRQEHEGFRAGRARNLGLARASGGYVVQIDGDMVLHPEFLADHCAMARRGCFVQGTRILLDAVRTRNLLDRGPRVLGPLAHGLGGLRRAYALRAPSISPLFFSAANVIVAVKGCNQAYWLADVRTVNGYDETLTGWGSEDKEFSARLENAGVRRRTALFGAIAWHLHHPPAARDRHSANDRQLERTRRERRVRCEAGLDRH